MKSVCDHKVYRSRNERTDGAVFAIMVQTGSADGVIAVQTLWQPGLTLISETGKKPTCAVSRYNINWSQFLIILLDLSYEQMRVSGYKAYCYFINSRCKMQKP